MFGVLAVYFTWFAPDPPAPVEETVTQESTQEEGTIQTDEPAASEPVTAVDVPDSIADAQNFQKYGALAFAVSENDETQTVETEDLKITFSSKGGAIKEVALVKHKDQAGNDFKVVDSS